MLSFGDYVDRIYPIELEIKDISDTDWSASHLDPHILIDSKRRLRTKTDDFTFSVVNFPSICINIPVADAYGEYISCAIPEFVVPNMISLIEGCH